MQVLDCPATMFVPRGGRKHGVSNKELPAVLWESAAHWSGVASSMSLWRCAAQGTQARSYGCRKVLKVPGRKIRITELQRHNGLRTIRRYWWYRARFRQYDDSRFGSPARFVTVPPTTERLALKEFTFSSHSLVWLSLTEAQSSPKCCVSPLD